MSDYFVFGNIDTRTYNGIYVFFDNIDETPEKVYETYEIPGRNGLFYMDQKRFEDAEHVYHIVALTESAASDLINALSSKSGYLRLNDSFHTGEFYSAVFTSIDDYAIPSTRDKVTFKAIFTRKPQRFLTSGETAVTVASGGTLTNPTLFEASPLLEVIGYGDITFEGQTVTLNDVPYGDLKVGNAETTELSVLATNIDTSRLNSGDVITLRNARGTISFKKKSGYSYVYGYLLSETNGRGYVSTDGKTTRFILNDIEFIYGTASTVTGSISIETDYRYNGENYEDTDTFTIRAEYDGGRNIRILATGYTPEPFTMNLREIGWDDIYAFSTESALTTSYIDLDLGEAWDIVDGTTASLNNVVQIPAKLPTLKPGTNTFTKSNTITSLKVTPRWWKV